jgi:hypothetical protein
MELRDFAKISKEQNQSVLILVEGDRAVAVQTDTDKFNQVTDPSQYGLMVSILRKKMQKEGPKSL